MSVRVEFRWSESLVEMVDAAAGHESRASWVRRAVMVALADREVSERYGLERPKAVERALDKQARTVENPAIGGVPGASGVTGPAPAEQPRPLTAIDKARAQRDQWAAASRTSKP